MTFGLSRLAGEVTEPITLADAKLHLRVDGTAEDDLIGSMITSARMSCEKRMQRSIVSQSWVLTQSTFGHPLINRHEYEAHEWINLAHFRARCRGLHDSIVLPMPAIQSVSSIAYLDRSSERVVLDASAYRLAVMGETLAMLRPVGGPWPRTALEPDAVVVTYLAGWSDATLIPGPVLSWIKLRVGALYENREEYAAGQAIPELGLADCLLDPFSIPVV